MRQRQFFSRVDYERIFTDPRLLDLESRQGELATSRNAEKAGSWNAAGASLSLRDNSKSALLRATPRLSWKNSEYLRVFYSVTGLSGHALGCGEPAAEVLVQVDSFWQPLQEAVTGDHAVDESADAVPTKDRRKGEVTWTLVEKEGQMLN
jgi:hypothetical protein